MKLVCLTEQMIELRHNSIRIIHLSGLFHEQKNVCGGFRTRTLAILIKLTLKLILSFRSDPILFRSAIKFLISPMTVLCSASGERKIQ